jgi:hypothetical protein
MRLPVLLCYLSQLTWKGAVLGNDGDVENAHQMDYSESSVGSHEENPNAGIAIEM